jgi:ElaB/YqjD/DUF883 family membrane-anchored ribosome-binding protein
MARPRKTASTKSFDAKLDALRTDIDALKNDTKSLVSEGEDIAHDRARAAMRTAEDVAERAYRLAEETTTDLADDVEIWTNDNLKSARERVQRQPISAMFVSLGLGVLVGAFFRRG